MLNLKQDIEIRKSQEPVPYLDAIEYMESRVNQIISTGNKQTLWFLEHPPIYTAGTGTNMQDLLSEQFEVFKTGRGGKLTYHGPGQRVVYLMLDLKALYNTHKPDLHKFVSDLERWIISALNEIGLNCFVKPGMVGVWTNHSGMDNKIAAIGIRVRKWICWHGVAINIDPDLDHFRGIIPCGISEFGVNSLRGLGFDTTRDELDDILIRKFAEIFL